ncbi:MAG: hypothetical protein NVSMB33_18010 [Ktedonobacteraceae bacterium]
MSCAAACNYSQGAVFQYQTTLTSGCKSYFFVFGDTNAGQPTSWTDPFNPSTYPCPAVGAQMQKIAPGVPTMPSYLDDNNDPNMG